LNPRPRLVHRPPRCCAGPDRRQPNRRGSWAAWRLLSPSTAWPLRDAGRIGAVCQVIRTVHTLSKKP